MTTSTVMGPVLGPDLTPLINTRVRIKLVAGAGNIGHHSSGEILSTWEARTNSSGAFSVALPWNTEITPSGTYYVAEIGRGAAQGVVTFQLDPANGIVAGGSYKLGDPKILVSAPEAPAFVKLTSAGVDLVSAQTVGGAKTFTAPLTGPIIDNGGMVVDLRSKGCPCDGIGDDTAAAQAALNALSPAGGGPGGTAVFPTLRLTGPLVVPRGVGLVSQSTQTQQATGQKRGVIILSGPTASVQFGDGTNANTSGPESGNFIIDASGQAAGATAPAFFSNLSDKRIFVNVVIWKASGDAFRVEQSQNCTFIGCQTWQGRSNGLVIDKGAGGLLFLSYEGAGSAGKELEIKETTGTGPYPKPTHIKFSHSLFEYKNAASGTALQKLLASSCAEVLFDTCKIGYTGLATANVVAELGATAEVRFRDCSLGGSATSTLLKAAAGAVLSFSGKTHFETASVGINIDGGAVGGAIERWPDMSNVTTPVSLTAGGAFGQFSIKSSEASAAIGPTAGVFTIPDPAAYGLVALLVNANSTCNAIPAGLWFGQKFRLVAWQHGGGFTFTWPANIKWGSGAAPALSTVNDHSVSVELFWDNANWREAA